MCYMACLQGGVPWPRVGDCGHQWLSPGSMGPYKSSKLHYKNGPKSVIAASTSRSIFRAL
jgi:hypothetical protein